MSPRPDRRHYRDQVTYTAEAVESLLPGVWDEEFVISGRPGKAAPNGPRTKGDPRHVPDWILMVADVQVGFARARLTEQEKSCLRHVHHLGFTPGALAESWSVQPEEIHHACMTGIQRITEYLNGRSPR